MRFSFRYLSVNVLVTLVLIGPHHGSTAAPTRSSGAGVQGRDVSVKSSKPDGGKSPKPDSGIVISGLRIEPREPSLENPFYGYDGLTSVVYPDQALRVIIFGNKLEDLGNISFVATSTKHINCAAANHTIITNHEDSYIWTNERFVSVMSFPEVEKGQIFHICYSTKDGIYYHLDDEFTRISTDVPPKEYYFPFWLQIFIVLFLLTLSGLFSGLNLGLMSLNPQELSLIIKSGSETEARYAESILPVREKGNMLLCSLLIGNVLVNSGISILLDDLTGSGYAALIGASAGIVVFGEIFPQSLCVKKGLAVGAKTIWITKFFIVLTWPIAWPISKLLDCILGEEIQSYDRKRILELIKMNSNGQLQEELRIAVGAMEIFDKTVASIMTTEDKIYMLPDDTILGTKMITSIVRSGFNRIPVHAAGDRNTVVSLLFVRDLALIDPDDNFNILTVCNYHQHPLRFVMEDTPVRVILDEFKRGDYHLAVVQRINENEDTDPTYEVVGVVTLEDIVEEIIQGEILDETDAYYNNTDRSKRRRNQQARDAYALKPVESRAITLQMQMVTYQWLVGRHRAFSEEMISKDVLQKMIRKQCKHVDVTTILPSDLRENGVPKHAKLFVQGEYAEKFVLILEGRAIVTIGQDKMTFEAGGWQAFGIEMLDRLVTRVDMENSKERDKPVSPSKSSLADKKFGFFPDYSVTVQDELTYLEIPATTWLSGFKLSCMGKGGATPLFLEHVVHSSPLGARSLSRASLDERKNLAVHPQLDAVRRNGKGRSASESEHVELLPRGLESGSPLSDRSVLSQI